MSTIAIAGAGVGGLVAAQKLALAGHDVTVYERNREEECGHEQKDSFDANIEAITDEKYADSVAAWKAMSDQLDQLVDEMETKKAQPMDFDYIPDTSKFEESMNTLVETVYGSSAGK